MKSVHLKTNRPKIMVQKRSFQRENLNGKTESEKAVNNLSRAQKAEINKEKITFSNLFVGKMSRNWRQIDF